MKLTDVGTVIAARELSLSAGKVVTVLIGKPKKFPDTDDYYLPYQVRGFGSEWASDAIQALELTLKMIRTDLYTWKEVRAGGLSWLGGKDLGFPVPDVLSDLPPNQP